MNNGNTSSQLLPVGTMLNGRYRIECYLASGGFGNTYKALDTNLECDVAIKEFYLSGYSTRGADGCTVHTATPTASELFEGCREKFVTEAKRISKLKSDHIVRVADRFDDNGTSYYVMEFIEGASLKQRIKEKGPLIEQEALNISKQLVDALDVVHASGFYHLDIKPNNVMLTPAGRAILIDFGASKQIEMGGGATQHSMMAHTPGYAPSEQIDQRADRVGAWTDFYALGATLYAMLTAQMPPSISDITDEGDEAFQFPTTVSETARKAVTTMMKPSTKKRPQNSDEVRKLLTVLQSEPHVDETAIIGGGSIPTPTKGEETVVMGGGFIPTPTKGEETVVMDGGNNVSLSSWDDAIPEVFTVNGVSFKMIKVDGGTFMMGATQEQQNPSEDEMPAHRVTLGRYMVGETVVTQELWYAVMGQKPWCFKGVNFPVESVSWYACQDFIKKLNFLTGKQFRLPTEAEWEFAARGGNKSKGYHYAGSDNLDEVGWYEGNSNPHTGFFSSRKVHAVAQKKPNELGIYDMSGNVWEWCQDSYEEDYYSKSTSVNPVNNTKTFSCINRGGSFFFYYGYCRVSKRSKSTPDDCSIDLGFRLAL